ncbi:MAG: restriction endonuclease subunit S [Microcystis sp. LE19-338.1B]|nr:restriction endonuclease subunit S [Microcystis sp. LE19-338.1B]MCZ8356765.1 restriction endonuclease subunit S [Microcystis sp. LE19-388.1G]
MRTTTFRDVLLEEIAEIKSGVGFPISMQGCESGDFPFAKVGDISNRARSGEQFISDAPNWVKNEDLSTLKFTPFPTGTIVFAKIGEAIRQNFRAVSTRPMLFDNNVMGVIPQEERVDTTYLYFYLRTLDFYHLAGKPTVPAIRKSTIEKLKIPLPPLEEQRRIAAILDKADGVRRKRKEAIRLTEELLKSTFLEMFGDPVTNPKGWEKIKLGNLCTIVRGGSPRPINDYLGGSIPWIKIGDATEGDDIYIHKTAEAIKPDGVKKSRYLEPGSLIFANCGVSLGFARILKIAGCIHDGWLAFSDLDKSINQIFLLKLLNSITEHFRAIAPAGTQPNLNTTIMKNFEIPVPPIDLQEKFAVVSHYLTDSIKKNSEMFEQSENLFNSLLQRAFRGEL